MIKIGSNDISKIYLGSTEIEKIYQGDTAIYSGGSEPTPPTPTPQYRWVNIDPNEQVDCVTREVVTPGPGGVDLTEVITDAYYLQKKQVSLDGGTTWTDVDPLETQRGELYEENSSLCFGTGGSDDECYTIQSNGNPPGDEIWSSDGTQFYGYVNDDEGFYYDTGGNPYPQEDYFFDIAQWLFDVFGVECQSDLGGYLIT